MIKIFKRFVLFAGIACLGAVHPISEQQRGYIKSFIDAYDIDAGARYAREYHGYLLERTKESFGELEAALADRGFALDGRVIIAGYEGNAVPSYYTDFQQSKIKDEATVRSKGGWSLQLHNMFGLMTGFLLKNINTIARQWCTPEQIVFEHVNPEGVEIFNDGSGIFEEHAFGKSYPMLIGYKETVERQVRRGNWDEVFNLLATFWRSIYNSNKGVNGESLAGTQDILFSISYADYLKNSRVPCKKYYTGGDITYPIETFIGQTREATKNAQDFSQKLASVMTPINDEPTVYVFCSFVDGVGKSTMLGNIQNRLKFGEDVERYERVDNSSSQYAQLQNVGNNVFIADLPAQVSHFTYKPDGVCYVPVESELSEEQINRALAHVRSHKKELEVQSYQLFDEVKKIIGQAGIFAPELNDPAKPQYAYVKNLFLLKKFTTGWVPFEFDGEHYLYSFFGDEQSDERLRILRPLGGAPSAGLKNIESEQMLFFEGVRFPIPFSVFLDDLITQLTGAGIKRVVFVDFLSMYPRSSRENVRINYLFQQLAMLNPRFNVNASLYKNFTSSAELYADLLDGAMYDAMFKAFVHETALRLGLFSYLEGRKETTLAGVSLNDLTKQMRNFFENIAEDGCFEHVVASCKEKFSCEFRNLKRTHGLTKDFVNVQSLSFPHLYAFARKLEECMKVCTGEVTEQVWQDMDGKLSWTAEQIGYVDQEATLENNLPIKILYAFPEGFKDSTYVGPCLTTLRANWYAMLGNLLFSTGKEMSPEVKALLWPISPITIKKNSDDSFYYVVQKLLEQFDGEIEENIFARFGVKNADDFSWGVSGEDLYAMNLYTAETHENVFAFDLNFNVLKEVMEELGGASSSLLANILGTNALEVSDESVKTPVGEVVYAYQKEHGPNNVVTSSLLYEELLRSAAWQKVRARLMEDAQKNGKFPLSGNQLTEFFKKKNRVFMGHEEQRAGARLLVVALATLEMVLKDPQANIAVRMGSKKDFVAALHLFEEVTLPRHFGVLFQEPLFDDYESVQPLIGWKVFGKS